jgi:hypothetical protein
MGRYNARFETKPLISPHSGEVFMVRFKLKLMTMIAVGTGVMMPWTMPAQADEVFFSCGDRVGPAATVSLDSRGSVPLVQWSTANLETLVKAAQYGCRVQSAPSSTRLYINPSPQSVQVDRVEVGVPSSSSVTVNVNSPAPYPYALW